jgi:hypothetical protein
MSLAILHTPRLSIHATSAPPRDRTSRVERALDHCKAEWHNAYQIAQEKGLPASRALRMASVAYKLAMPKLDTLPAIRAHIAAVAQGVVLEVFTGRDASQLLYAAQVALSVLHQKGRKA